MFFFMSAKKKNTCLPLNPIFSAFHFLRFAKLHLNCLLADFNDTHTIGKRKTSPIFWVEKIFNFVDEEFWTFDLY